MHIAHYPTKWHVPYSTACTRKHVPHTYYAAPCALNALDGSARITCHRALCTACFTYQAAWTMQHCAHYVSLYASESTHHATCYTVQLLSGQGLHTTGTPPEEAKAHPHSPDCRLLHCTKLRALHHCGLCYTAIPSPGVGAGEREREPRDLSCSSSWNSDGTGSQGDPQRLKINPSQVACGLQVTSWTAPCFTVPSMLHIACSIAS